MTSFKKAGRAKVVHPRGTKPSLHNSQLLISSGTPSLDTLLGNNTLCEISCALLEIYRWASYWNRSLSW